MEIHLRTAGCRLPYGITQFTRHKRTHLALTPASEGWYSIYLGLPRRDRRLSWPGWLVTYRDGLPAPQTVTHPSINRARCLAFCKVHFIKRIWWWICFNFCFTCFVRVFL